DLHADVAAHRDRAPDGVDVGPHETGLDLLVHRPGLRDQVVQVIDRVEGHVAGDHGRYVPRRDLAHPGEAQVDQAVLEFLADGDITLRTDIDRALGLALALAAVGVVDAHVD